MFDSRVRTISVAFPDWKKSPAVTLRASLAQAVLALGSTPADAVLTREITDKLDIFDPFFIVRDETVRRAEELLIAENYAAIICNYTHCVRVVAELARRRALPSIAIITHDALSRLPREFEGKKLDTGYRFASMTGERAALDAVPGAVVVAISRSEAEYFREIGVTNPIVLCEYDAWEETEGRRVPAAGFAARRLIFPGSSNPMNVAGMVWFLEQCWPTIRRAVPEARLTICGSVCRALGLEPGDASGATGIEALGDVERDVLLDLCAASSVLINPCVAGTGLKIKTVEAAAAGLPVVCLPSAVDGLEDDAAHFGLVTRTAADFAQACIALLTREAQWRALHEGALALAQRRFSRHAVYRSLDAAMGLDLASVPPRAELAEEMRHLPNPAEAAVRLEMDPQDAEALMVLAAPLIRAKQQAAGWSVVREAYRRQQQDPLLATVAARLALQAGEPWEAVLLGARLAAGDPANAEPYRLMGLGLLETGLADEAIAAIEQAILLAPADISNIEALIRALSVRGRTDEAAAWAGRVERAPVFGEYVLMSLARLPAEMRKGWLPGDAARIAPGGEARFLVRLPAEPPDRIWLEVDLSLLPGADVVDVSVAVAGRSRRASLSGEGMLRTLTIPIDVRALSSEQVEIGLRFPTSVTSAEIVGFILRPIPPAAPPA
jgi:glycosyltransferase involved in cell wall biosynthesis